MILYKSFVPSKTNGAHNHTLLSEDLAMGRRKKEPRWNVYVSDSQGLRRLEYLEGQEKEELLGIDTQQASCSEDFQPEYDDHWAGDYDASMEEHEFPAEVKLRANILNTQRRAWIGPDGRETHFMQQACDMETGDLIKGKYTFVGVRMVQYADEQCEVSWYSCSLRQSCSMICGCLLCPGLWHSKSCSYAM